MRSLTWLVIILALLLGGRAHAAPPSAKEIFAEAQAAFARGDFVAAASAFEETARIQPHPAPLMNAAEAWERAGQPVRAAEDCDRVLAMPDLAPAFADPARARLARLSSSIATVNVTTPVGSYAQVDAAPPDRIPFRKRLAPGSHVVALRGTGEASVATRNLELAGGEVVDVAFAPPRTDGAIFNDPPPRPPPPRRSAAPPIGSFVAFGFGAVALGTTTYFGVRTLDLRSEFERTPTLDIADDFDTAKVVTNVLVGVALVSLAAGVVLWIISATR